MSLVLRQSLRRHLNVAGLASAFALIQSHIITLEFKMSGYMVSANAAAGVISGHPYWREFQSRVLAPYIILALSKISHSFLSAHFVFGILSIALAGYLSWQLGLRVGGDNKSALIAFLVMQFSFSYLLSPPWLYAWDYLGVVIFLVFVLMVIDRKSWCWFAGLFVVAILNRESGEFIALWMVVDPFVRAFFKKSDSDTGRRINWSMALAGVCCLGLGFAIVEFLRAHLMIEETGPRLFADAGGHQTGVVFLQMSTNIKEIGRALHHIRNGFEAPMLFFPLAALYYSVRLAVKDPMRWLGLCLISLANLGAIFVVGVFLETRVYLELLPFVILGILISISGSGVAEIHEVSSPGSSLRGDDAVIEPSGR